MNMPTNTPPVTATDYHAMTGYRRHELTPHRLDWANQPAFVKRYPQLPRIPLAREAKAPRLDFFAMVHGDAGEEIGTARRPDVKDLARIFHLTHDVTARAMPGGNPFYFRSVASAGALYPFELYLAVHDVEGLGPGVYHYDVLDFSLTRLRQQPVPVLPLGDHAVGATFYLTGIFFRSAWKYRDRAYRYVLLDAGHLMENLRLALGALDFAFSVHLDFDDRRVAALLGVDPQREACLAAVHLHQKPAGKEPEAPAGAPAPLGREVLRASTVSNREVAYPKILAAHRAGYRVVGQITGAQGMSAVAKIPSESWIEPGQPGPWAADYAQVLKARRSYRNFIPASVSREAFAMFVTSMAGHVGRASAMPSACRQALTMGLLLGDRMPQPAGFYLLDPRLVRLGPVRPGRLTDAMATACLDQMWLKHAAMHLLFFTDLRGLDRTWGARGYRYAMLEAGRLGQRAYLVATALGWGACGIGAMYDGEAGELLGLPDDIALVYLVGVGPVKSRLKS